MAKNRPVLAPERLAELESLLDARQMEGGTALMSELLAVFASATADTPNFGFAAGLLAQWADAGFDDRGLLELSLRKLPNQEAVRLPLAEYLQVRLAKASVALRHENTPEANEHLDLILAVGADLPDKKALILANFWKSRGLRKAGEYDAALRYAQRARELAMAAQSPKLGAVIQTQESWLLFQKGNNREAVKVLREAETALGRTDDYITLGNIQSAYGRIARREGRYQQAIDYFENSLHLFERHPSLEGHYARSLTNLAKAKRLLAGELRRRVDSRLERRQSGAAEPAGDNKPKDLERIRHLLGEAQNELVSANEIYRRFESHHGLGNVQIGFAEIFLDLGKLEAAERAAAEAFQLGLSKTDYLLMCRARLAQAINANARYEDEFGGSGGPSRYAHLASDCAREAVGFAEHTQGPRILARAYTWQGLILLNGFFDDVEAARASANKAEEYMGDRHGALWDDFQLLRSKLLRGGQLDPNLRAWSQGSVGGKTLQEVVEEFEALLISKVWERESHKVLRVAQRLSVSPKKVRRLLRGSGLLRQDESPGIG